MNVVKVESAGLAKVVVESFGRKIAIDGYEPVPKTVEVAYERGRMPGFSLPESVADAGAIDRVRCALKAAGYADPCASGHATVAVTGPPCDVFECEAAIAAGLLAASGQIPEESVDGKVLVGTLSLDGSVGMGFATLPTAWGGVHGEAREVLSAWSGGALSEPSGLGVLRDPGWSLSARGKVTLGLAEAAWLRERIDEMTRIFGDEGRRDWYDADDIAKEVADFIDDVLHKAGWDGPASEDGPKQAEAAPAPRSGKATPSPGRDENELRTAARAGSETSRSWEAQASRSERR